MDATAVFLSDAAASAAALAGDLDAAQQQLAPVNGRPAQPTRKDTDDRPLQPHFGFTTMPFGRDLAPAMLHRHAAHAEAAARISWCITEKALGVITGEVGAGKTVAVRAACRPWTPPGTPVIYLANPAIGVRGIHVPHRRRPRRPARRTTAALIAQAADLLAAEAAERGRTPVLLIDFSDRPRWRPPRPASLLLAA